MSSPHSEAVLVIDAAGRQGYIAPNQLNGSEENQVLVTHGEDRLILVEADLLEVQDDETYRLHANFADFDGRSAEQERVVIPVIEEHLDIRKRPVVKDRVRLVKTVEEELEEFQAAAREENLHVERVAVNRVVEEPAALRTEGETLIVPLHREVLVVRKQYVLTEEIHIVKTEKMTQETRTVPLRKERLVVERGVAPESTDSQP